MHRGGRERRPSQTRARGSAYLALLVAVTVAGILLGVAGQVWHTTARREKEAELLFVGEQFSRALASYAARTPAGGARHPERLEDLLLDPRFPMPVRHLRRLYPDPMTGEADWLLVRAGGRIVALHSRSGRRPLREAFTGTEASFAGAMAYRDWVFRPGELPSAAGLGR